MARLAALLVVTSAGAPAQPGDRSVISIRHMPASPDEVIRAFVDGDELAGWWKVTRSLVEAKKGGVWSIAWDDWGPEETQHAWSGVIREIGPGRLVIGKMVMIEPGMPLFGPMELEVLAEPEGDGSSVTVTHSGYGYGDDWDRMYELVVTGWDHVLGDLQHWFDERY